MRGSTGSLSRHWTLQSLFTSSFVLVTIACFLWLPAGADERHAVPAISDHLAAGEFGPARELALAIGDPQQRDAQLQQIALTQIQAGADQAALDTVGEIYDNNFRAASYRRIRSRLGEAPSRGGGPQADFDPLIELITTTIEPDSWDEVGGDGAVVPFEAGVYVDARGLMHRIKVDKSDDLMRHLRRKQRIGDDAFVHADTSGMRRISLPRLEQAVQRRWARGLPPTEEMQYLAGLQRVQYVLVYPDERDVVLVGPGGPWHYDSEGRAVSDQTGAPVLLLDDLVVLLRNALSGMGRFGCSITPRKENLASAQTFLKKSANKSIRPGRRATWLAQLREQLGTQDIEMYGVDPRTHVGRVIIEADYHMKLIGMGLEDGVPGVQSYLDSIEVGPGEAPPEMDVLRWWFTLNYRDIHCNARRDAFEIRGPGVKVQSENELLSELGERIHTGKSDELNLRFVNSFTRHFDELSEKYPIYGQLRAVFDMAMVAALIRAEDLTQQVNWHAVHFLDESAYQVQLGPAPQEVETVINHRVLNRKYFIAGVSGGVSANPRLFMSKRRVVVTNDSQIESHRSEVFAKADPWWK